jgi:hypothetical protein
MNSLTVTETITGFAGLAVVFAVGIYWAIRTNRKSAAPRDTSDSYRIRVVHSRDWRHNGATRSVRIRKVAA